MIKSRRTNTLTLRLLPTIYINLQICCKFKHAINKCKKISTELRYNLTEQLGEFLTKIFLFAHTAPSSPRLDPVFVCHINLSTIRRNNCYIIACRDLESRYDFFDHDYSSGFVSADRIH